MPEAIDVLDINRQPAGTVPGALAEYASKGIFRGSDGARWQFTIMNPETGALLDVILDADAKILSSGPAEEMHDADDLTKARSLLAITLPPGPPVYGFEPWLMDPNLPPPTPQPAPAPAPTKNGAGFFLVIATAAAVAWLISAN